MSDGITDSQDRRNNVEKYADFLAHIRDRIEDLDHSASMLMTYAEMAYDERIPAMVGQSIKNLVSSIKEAKTECGHTMSYSMTSIARMKK